MILNKRELLYKIMSNFIIIYYFLISSRKVVFLDSENNFIKIYNSIKDCSNDTEYGFSQIYDRLRGKYENNLPHKFIYLKDYKEDYDLEIDLHKNSEED